MEVIEDQGIKFEVRMLESLGQKPKGENAFTKKADFDPFMPPFEDGLFITDLTESHSLVFNKFSVCKEHVICITKDFVRQDSPLCLKDIQACLLVMDRLDAFMFFNCGPHSGASILHKHMQLIPYHSIGNLPIQQVYD